MKIELLFCYVMCRNGGGLQYARQWNSTKSLIRFINPQEI